MKLTQEFKDDFSSFLIKLFIVVWCSSLCISIGGLFLQVQSDLNSYKLFAMLMFGFFIIIMISLFGLFTILIITGTTDSLLNNLKKIRFHKGN